MPGFERLHPHLRHAITHELGWRSLRPVQELAIEATLDGCNSVILAPTAGGKTEAAVFPTISQVLTEDSPPVAVLYICPIRALLNNQEERLQSYTRMVGLDAFKWHGDVSDSRRQRFRDSPTHFLMTTPESLEVMLISAKTDARVLFRTLSAVVIDEIHAFAGDDRGAHLASLLERLVWFCGRDLQRIGLSATVGNPLVIGQWLQGSSGRPFRLVDPPRPETRRDLRVDFCDDVDTAASGIARIARGRKSLVFVESRSKAERVAHALGGSGVEVFIHHSSISRTDRALAEAQFAGGHNTAIVCTSTLELGIDVGDLDQVIQVDSPATVASFLQRLGRTGRRAPKRSNCTFFCLTPESLLQSIALLRLAERGWVEKIRPASQAMHILAHQVMALALQEGGISRHRLLPWVEAAYPFSNVREERLQELIDTMLARDILYEGDGVLSLGRRGERLYGRKNFFDLYAVFSSPPVMRVMRRRDEVGYVQALFVAMHDRSEGPLCFRLAGRAWEVVQSEWSRGVLRVRPAKRGRVPTWLGLPGVLSTELCQAMMDVLLQKGEEARWLTRSAARELATVREGYQGLLAAGTAPLEESRDGIQWHTFAGGAVNRLLAAGLETRTAERWVAGNLSVRSKDIGLAAARDGVRGLSDLDWEQVAASAAHGMERGSLSKFQPCLPADAEDRFLAEKLLDLQATLRFLGSVMISAGEPVAGRPRGARLTDDETLGSVTFELPAATARPGTLSARNAIEWVDTPAALRAAVAKIAPEAVVGLDVETTLDSRTLCLVQIATSEKSFLIDPFAVPLGPLAGVLAAPRPLKVIHHATFERRVMASVEIKLGGVFDTLEASRKIHGADALGGHSLAMVCERELGSKLDKSPQTSNWSRRPLDAEQIRYAALDAEILICLYQYLS